MGDLSKNLSRWEFACKDNCGQDTIDSELITVLQETRDHFNRLYGRSIGDIPLLPSSGNRCPIYNKLKEGEEDSKHLISKACDFRMPGISVVEIYNYLNRKYPNKYGLGLYIKDGFVHLDVRSNKARW